MRRLWPLALSVAACGCATVRPQDRIHVGDSPEQVLAVYGKPDRVYKRETAQGELSAWGYMPYWPGFGLPPEPIGSRGSLSSEIPLESIRDDEDVRVFFKQNKVAVIEYRAAK